jgi:hypothetical protein
MSPVGSGCERVVLGGIEVAWLLWRVVEVSPAGERGSVQTYLIHVSNGRDRVHEIRSHLFVFPEVLDVFVTGRPDSLVVVCRGRPRPGEWLQALRAVGYDLLPRRRSGTPAAKVDRTTVVAPLRREAPSASTTAATRRRDILRAVV